jgi:hypothetical protein
MTTRTLPTPLQIPNTSYGPFRVLEPVPWLLLASVFRVFAAHGGLRALAGLTVSAFALFIAFLLASRRMIESADGQTGLGKLPFAEQMRLSRQVLGRVLAVMAVGWISVCALVSPLHGAAMLYGFDGTAFDHVALPQMVWSGVIGALVLIMIIQVGAEQPLSLKSALGEFAARWRSLVPAIAILTALYFGLSFLQGLVRRPVQVFYSTSTHLPMIKNLVYVGYVLVFATIRLWCTRAVLTFAMRHSYRRGEAEA